MSKVKKNTSMKAFDNKNDNTCDGKAKNIYSPYFCGPKKPSDYA